MSIDKRSSPPQRGDNQITTFDQFWLHYLREHADAKTRGLHFTGLVLAIALAVALLAMDAPLYSLLVVPIVPYGFAWAGHFLYEHNNPTTFHYPLWSLISYFRMFRYWLIGRLPAELQRAGVVEAGGKH